MRRINQLKRKVGELMMNLDILCEGGEATPYDAEDIRRVRSASPGKSIRRLCRIMNLSRARLRAREVVIAASSVVDEVLAERIQRDRRASGR